MSRKPLPKDQMKAWTILELRARCFVTVCDCWEWRTAEGKIPPSEHGRRFPNVNHKGENITVRRLAWELVNGRRVPDGMKASPEKCCNPRCQNPWHTRPVTEAQRQQRTAAEGGYSTPARKRAIALGRRKSAVVKLDEDKAARIRSIKGPAHLHCAEFGIDKSMFNRIRRGESWKPYT
jgi:hypothetical protein